MRCMWRLYLSTSIYRSISLYIYICIFLYIHSLSKSSLLKRPLSHNDISLEMASLNVCGVSESILLSFVCDLVLLLRVMFIVSALTGTTVW